MPSIEEVIEWADDYDIDLLPFQIKIIEYLLYLLEEERRR